MAESYCIQTVSPSINTYFMWCDFFT